MKEQITYDIFNKVDIRVGTVIVKNEKARKPSLVVEVDFGSEIVSNNHQLKSLIITMKKI